MLDIINRFGHGFVTVPTLLALERCGMFQRLKEVGVRGAVGEELAREFDARPGFFRVALRLLESLGILDRVGDGRYEAGSEMGLWADLPQRILALDSSAIEQALQAGTGPGVSDLKWACEASAGRWGGRKELVSDFLDGIVVIPVALYLWPNRTKLTGEQRGSAWLNSVHEVVRPVLLEWFERRGWQVDGGLTESGVFLLNRAMNLEIGRAHV